MHRSDGINFRLTISKLLIQSVCTKGKDPSRNRLLAVLNGCRFEDGEKICELCQAKFHFVTRLVAHLRIAHGIHRPFKCITCGKNYPQQFMLNAHVKKSHTPKTVPCAQCSFMGVNVTDVERHKRRRHRVPKFTCEICSEDFADKDALIAHTAMHDFMQYQRCNACGSIFNDVYRYIFFIAESAVVAEFICGAFQAIRTRI